VTIDHWRCATACRTAEFSSKGNTEARPRSAVNCHHQSRQRHQSIDTVTVTVGGKAPSHVLASTTIQSAIDAAAPGDLIIVTPLARRTAGATQLRGAILVRSHPVWPPRMLLMWKPSGYKVSGLPPASSTRIPPCGQGELWRTRSTVCSAGDSGSPNGWSAGCAAGWTASMPLPIIRRSTGYLWRPLLVGMPA